jgi:vancomycin resistance protein VanW
LLGKPTKAKGYVEGFVLDNGKVKPGIGGGLCQLANLIFWMTLHTPLIVIERWRHSYDVFPDSGRTVPFGSGATCAYPSLDLQIKNTTSQPVQLCLKLSDSHLIGEWKSLTPFEYSYEVYEAFHEITCDFQGRYVRHNILRRRVLNKQKQEIADEYVTENHALMMYQPLLSEKSQY